MDLRSYLIVDDHRAFADSIAQILRDHGASATVAGGGAEALDLARLGRFDALITDLRMPDMSGASLIKKIRELAPGMPALVITGSSLSTDLDDAERAGVVAVLPKPVPFRRLLAALESLDH